VSDETPRDLGSARLRDDYEHLRAAAITGGERGWGWGRGVLQRSGVAHWMRIWSEHTSTRTEPSMNEHPATAVPCSTAPHALDADAMVGLLAQLVRGILNATSRAATPSLGVNA
jgi:hypothetical protein